MVRWVVVASPETFVELETGLFRSCRLDITVPDVIAGLDDGGVVAAPRIRGKGRMICGDGRTDSRRSGTG